MCQTKWSLAVCFTQSCKNILLVWLWNKFLFFCYNENFMLITNLGTIAMHVRCRKNSLQLICRTYIFQIELHNFILKWYACIFCLNVINVSYKPFVTKHNFYYTKMIQEHKYVSFCYLVTYTYQNALYYWSDKTVQI